MVKRPKLVGQHSLAGLLQSISTARKITNVHTKYHERKEYGNPSLRKCWIDLLCCVNSHYYQDFLMGLVSVRVWGRGL